MSWISSLICRVCHLESWRRLSEPSLEQAQYEPLSHGTYSETFTSFWLQDWFHPHQLQLTGLCWRSAPSHLRWDYRGIRSTFQYLWTGSHPRDSSWLSCTWSDHPGHFLFLAFIVCSWMSSYDGCLSVIGRLSRTLAFEAVRSALHSMAWVPVDWSCAAWILSYVDLHFVLGLECLCGPLRSRLLPSLPHPLRSWVLSTVLTWFAAPKAVDLHHSWDLTGARHHRLRPSDQCWQRYYSYQQMALWDCQTSFLSGSNH